MPFWMGSCLFYHFSHSSSSNLQNFPWHTDSDHSVGFSNASRHESIRVDHSGFGMRGVGNVEWPHLWVSEKIVGFNGKNKEVLCFKENCEIFVEAHLLTSTSSLSLSSVSARRLTWNVTTLWTRLSDSQLTLSGSRIWLLTAAILRRWKREPGKRSIQFINFFPSEKNTWKVTRRDQRVEGTVSWIRQSVNDVETVSERNDEKAREKANRASEKDCRRRRRRCFLGGGD